MRYAMCHLRLLFLYFVRDLKNLQKPKSGHNLDCVILSDVVFTRTYLCWGLYAISVVWRNGFHQMILHKCELTSLPLPQNTGTLISSVYTSHIGRKHARQKNGSDTSTGVVVVLIEWGMVEQKSI